MQARGEIASYAVWEKELIWKQPATSLQVRGTLNWCKKHEAELLHIHGKATDMFGMESKLLS